MWENFVKKNYGHISLKNILEKMFIKVTIIKDNFWLTLNEKVFE